MIQQRKKDYLQRIIEEFFAEFSALIDDGSTLTGNERKELLYNGFEFYTKNFDTQASDMADTLVTKIQDINLLEHYVKLLLLKNELVDIKDSVQLYVALDIIKYLQAVDLTYSWSRTVLREDLLRLLDE